MSDPEAEKQIVEKVEDTCHAESPEVVFLSENGKIRNIPLPSNSPDDPLNFGALKQRTIIAVVCLFGITAFGVIQSTPLYFGELIPYYMKETRGEFDTARINDLASYPSLCMGISNFLFVPLSIGLGRRFSLLCCNVLMVASTIWAATSTSFHSHLGARCLQGLAGGAADCLLPMIVLDISFLHKRGHRLVFYWAMTAIGSSFLLVAVPWIVHAAGENWRVNYWFWTGWAVLSLILTIFGLPETIFQRPPMALQGRILATDSYGTVRNFASATEARAAGFEMMDTTGEQDSADVTRRSQFMPFHPQKPGCWSRIIRSFRDIFLCLLIPGCLWTLILNTLLFSGLVILSLYYSRSLESPPWNFTPPAVGTVQVGAAIGAIASLLVTGILSEAVVGYQTRRNGGVRNPFFHIVNFILPSALAFVGLAIYAVVTNEPEKYSWVGVHASFAIFYYAFCAISALTGVWLAELLPSWSGPAIVLCSGGRNAVSFGLTNSFESWISSMGFKAYIILGSLVMVVAILGTTVAFLHKVLHRWIYHLTK